MPPYGGKYKAAPYGCGLFTIRTQQRKLYRKAKSERAHALG